MSHLPQREDLLEQKLSLGVCSCLPPTTVLTCESVAVFLCCLFHYAVQDGYLSADCLSMLFVPLHCTGWLFVSRLSFYVVCSTTQYRMAVCHLIVFLCCLFHYTVQDGYLSADCLSMLFVPLHCTGWLFVI